MASNQEFFTHGVNIAIEHPERCKVIVRRGPGTTIEQDAGTEGWFHFAIPTPTTHDGASVSKLVSLRLRASQNTNSNIDRVTAHVDNGGRFLDQVVDWREGSINKEVTVSLPDTNGAVCFCVHVKFLSGSPRGQITFHSASGKFNI